MNLVTLTDPRSVASEAYRILRTNLSFYSLDNPIGSLVVTSPSVGEGKSTTIANLAVTMAQGGIDTILVDCDLRRPSLHEFFDLQPAPGFVDFVLDETREPNLQATGVDRLRLLASGPQPPNPADLLGARKMGDIVAAIKEQAELVLYDAPPVLAVTDAAILGAKVDGVLLVLQAGKTRREHAGRAKEVLEQARVRIIGATLTNAPRDRSIGGYYG